MQPKLCETIIVILGIATFLDVDRDVYCVVILEEAFQINVRRNLRDVHHPLDH